MVAVLTAVRADELPVYAHHAVVAAEAVLAARQREAETILALHVGRLVDGRLVGGRFVDGRLINGRFVGGRR